MNKDKICQVVINAKKEHKGGKGGGMLSFLDRKAREGLR